MNEPNSILVVAASNRPHSNSAAIARYLTERLETEPCRVGFCEVDGRQAVAGDFSRLVEEATVSRQIILVCSLYHDSCNFTATRTLEILQETFGREQNPAKRRFAAFVHSGYPEPVHCSVAIAVCRAFAAALNWQWLGGMSAGGTSPIGGNPLADLGFMTRNLRRGLDLAAPALAQGKPIPLEAVRAARRPSFPAWLLKPLGNFMMWHGAYKAGTADLHAKPYENAQ